MMMTYDDETEIVAAQTKLAYLVVMMAGSSLRPQIYIKTKTKTKDYNVLTNCLILTAWDLHVC
jgi:hypothetical protein